MAQTALKTKTVEVPVVPEGYEDDLGEYGPVGYDNSCGEPTSWGFPLRRHLGEERFNALRGFGSLECIGFPNGRWSLVVKTLTRAEAIEKYGPVTDEDRGPRGGFRSITFGDKKFLTRHVGAAAE